MNIELRRFSEDDFSRLIDCLSTEEELFQWSGPAVFKYPLTRQQLLDYLHTLNPSHELHLFTAIHTETESFAGHIELSINLPERERATILNVFVDPQCRGKGYCRRLIDKILEFGFTNYPLHKINLVVFADNIPAIKCYENAGFKTDKILEKFLRVNGLEWDAFSMSLRREAWIRNTTV